jgi:DNA-binding SARP family transcriptional activator
MRDLGVGCMDMVEVRVLGPLLVRRPDGSIVGGDEWRTSKTLDLLRLLTLNGGRPVPVPTVIERLWPDVDWDHGRASLRTAASQLRKVLGVDCIERQAGSLQLARAWVDAWAWTELAHESDLARRAGDHEGVVALVRKAEGLYAGDVEVTSGEWDGDAATWFRDHRLRLLLDGAEAAGRCGWVRDGLDFALRAREIDLTEEVARALMRAYAGLGATDRALDVYEELRHHLDTRLGVDPAPQTRALHMLVLSGTATLQAQHRAVGAEEAVGGLVSAVRRMSDRSDGCGVVWVCGPPGSGRSTVVALAAEELGVPVYDMSMIDFDEELAGRLSGTRSPGAEPGLVVLQSSSMPPAWSVGIVHAVAARYDGVVVVKSTEAPEARPDLSCTDARVQVEPLSTGDFERLVRMVVQGEPSTALLQRLWGESGGLAGRACRLARGWLGEGRLVWQEEGLVLVPAASTLRHVPPGPVLRTTLRSLGAPALDVLTVLALADTALDAEQVGAVLAAVRDAPAPAGVLERLVDYGFVDRVEDGYELPSPALAGELAGWVRPMFRHQVVEALDALSLPRLDLAPDPEPAAAGAAGAAAGGSVRHGRLATRAEDGLGLAEDGTMEAVSRTRPPARRGRGRRTAKAWRPVLI